MQITFAISLPAWHAPLHDFVLSSQLTTDVCIYVGSQRIFMSASCGHGFSNRSFSVHWLALPKTHHESVLD